MQPETQTNSKLGKKLIALLFALLLLATSWKASSISGLKATRAKVSSKSTPDPAATDSISCVGPGGSLQCDEAGNFVATHDSSEFGTDNDINPVWTVSDHSIDRTPPVVGGISFDDPRPLDAMFAFNGGPSSGFANDPGNGAASAGFQGGGFQGSGYFGGFPYTGGTPGSTNSGTNRKTTNVKVSIGDSDDPAPTPEPSSLLFLVSGLVSLAGFARRR